jgi:predicted transcriptional regulator
MYEISLPPAALSRTLKAMEVNFAPDLQARIDRFAVETGRAPEKLVEDAVAGYVAELAQTREILDGRYDDLKSGRVKPTSGDEVIASLRAKSAARRAPGS